jgi:hypothetical protein
MRALETSVLKCAANSAEDTWAPVNLTFQVYHIMFDLAMVFAGMLVSVKLDVRINREYEEGKLVRGIRLLTHSEYSNETKGVDGLGLPLFRTEGTQQ